MDNSPSMYSAIVKPRSHPTTHPCSKAIHPFPPPLPFTFPFFLALRDVLHTHVLRAQ